MKKNHENNPPYTIGVVTGTRADYHLLYPLLKRIWESDRYTLRLIVTGAHLSPCYGETVRDIEKDGIPIGDKIPILSDRDSVSDIHEAMSRGFVGFDRCFRECRPDILILLGDRYEILAAAFVAMNYHIPIAHIAGGETTEGAIDESIRHSVTKMSTIHFPTCEVYRRRVIQLGESPDRVFNVGGLGIENIRLTERLELSELERKLDFDLQGGFAVFTYHPVTLGERDVADDFGEVLAAMDEFADLKILFTKANADSGGQIINRMIDEYADRHPEWCKTVYSLGLTGYLSALSSAEVVIGNSSSGLSETPPFHVPTVNIGDRQKGRIIPENVICCTTTREDIVRAVNEARSVEFRGKAAAAENPFGDGHTSERILEKLDYFFEHMDKFSLKKQFFDIENGL